MNLLRFRPMGMKLPNALGRRAYGAVGLVALLAGCSGTGTAISPGQFLSWHLSTAAPSAPPATTAAQPTSGPTNPPSTSRPVPTATPAPGTTPAPTRQPTAPPTNPPGTNPPTNPPSTNPPATNPPATNPPGGQPPTSPPGSAFTPVPGTTSFTMEVNFFGWADNGMSNAITLPTLHRAAGGTGTYADPITFSGFGPPNGPFKPGDKLYLPSVEKYVIMEDDNECDPLCISAWINGFREIEVWLESNQLSNINAVTNCGDYLSETFLPVAVNPPANLYVNPLPLFVSNTLTCFDYPGPIPITPPVGSPPAPVPGHT